MKAKKMLENIFIFPVLIGILFVVFFVPEQLSAKGVKDFPFAPGEKLIYHLKWNGLVAAKIVLRVMPFEEIDGKKNYHFSMEGSTTSLVSAFVRYQIKIDSFVDSTLKHSVYYESSDVDRKYDETVKINFDWEKNKSRYSVVKKKKKKLIPNRGKKLIKKKKTISIDSETFDVFASMYNLRRLLMNLGGKKQIPVSVTNGRKFLKGNVYVLEDEILKLKGKKYNTKALKLDVKTLGNVFEIEEKKYLLDLWVSDDEYKIPLKVKGKVKFGSVVAELISIERNDSE